MKRRGEGRGKKKGRGTCSNAVIGDRRPWMYSRPRSWSRGASRTKMKVLVLVLDHQVLVLVLVLNIWSWYWSRGLEEKVLQFFKTFVVILDSSGQKRHTTAFCERQQKQFAIRRPLSEKTLIVLRSMHISLS